MRNILLFLLLALMWSGSFIFIKITVDAFPPVFSAAVRVFIAFITLTLLFISQRKKFLTPLQQCPKLWITGLFAQALPFAFLFYGEKFIAPALAAILNSTVSLWALLLGSLLFRDNTHWSFPKISGLLLGFGGILLIFLPFIGQHHNSMIGVMSVLAMAICYAIGGLLNQHWLFKKARIPMEICLWQQHLASLLFLLLISFLLEPSPSFALFNFKISLAFLYLGVVATAFAWMIYFYLLRAWDAVRAASVMYLVPLLAMCWDFIFLHHTPSLNEIAGAGAILTGVVLIQVKRREAIKAL